MAIENSNTKRIDWFKVGSSYWTDKEQSIQAAIELANWHEHGDGKKWGAMQWMLFDAAIKAFDIPKVRAFTDLLPPWNHLYGIRAQYQNGLVDVFFADTGHQAVPVCAVVYLSSAAVA